jgi:hypothetical protein
MHSHHFRSKEIDRLAKHAGFRFDPTDSPPDDAKSIDHRGMRIGSNQCVWITNFAFRRGSTEHTVSKVFQIHLMHDADARRHHAKGLKRLLAPLQKFVTFSITFKLIFEIEFDRFWDPGKIYLDRMIDNQVNWHQWFDNFRVLTDLCHRSTHGRQINQQRHTGEILQYDPGHDERNLFLRRVLRIPTRQRRDIFFGNLLSITVPENRFQHDSETDRKSRNRSDSRFFQRGQ